jgi:hypothetical protein
VRPADDPILNTVCPTASYPATGRISRPQTPRKRDLEPDADASALEHLVNHLQSGMPIEYVVIGPALMVNSTELAIMNGM